MKIHKKFKYLITAGLLGLIILLGGCAAAAMTAVGKAEEAQKAVKSQQNSSKTQ